MFVKIWYINSSIGLDYSFYVYYPDTVSIEEVHSLIDEDAQVMLNERYGYCRYDCDILTIKLTPEEFNSYKGYKYFL